MLQKKLHLSDTREDAKKKCVRNLHLLIYTPDLFVRGANIRGLILYVLRADTNQLLQAYSKPLSDAGLCSLQTKREERPASCENRGQGKVRRQYGNLGATELVPSANEEALSSKRGSLARRALTFSVRKLYKLKLRIH
jgi:hypothetical protein